MKKLITTCLTICLSAALALPASALDCVSASYISLAPPQAAELAHSAALPFPGIKGYSGNDKNTAERQSCQLNQKPFSVHRYQLKKGKGHHTGKIA